MSHTELLLKAAEIIHADAWSLRECHTLRGRWPKSEADAKAEYVEMMKTVKALRKAADYFHSNPLGGPAKVFDACADMIRAGASMEVAMREFGLKWAKER